MSMTQGAPAPSTPPKPPVNASAAVTTPPKTKPAPRRDRKGARPVRKSLDAFNELQTLLGLNDAGLCVLLGFSRSAAWPWRKQNSMPESVFVTCQALIENFKMREKVEFKLLQLPTIALVTVTPANREMVLGILRTLSVQFTIINGAP